MPLSYLRNQQAHFNLRRSPLDLLDQVNCIAPGIIRTRFSEPLLQAGLSKDMIIGRPGRPEEIAASIAFLVSDDSSYMSGESLTVSGGMHSRL
mmetsp:Transcript_43426/g.169915  ORF Transcript_43426/g.169915 Transcript_43426/m.169915 type:complete len:93 (-) Transcript_43426:697-975(-)